MRLLDIVGELCYDSKEMLSAYIACNEFAKIIKEKINQHTVCLILSDHGMERFGATKYGKHSNHAFYSLNIETDWKPKTITDFYSKIIHWLRIHPTCKYCKLKQKCTIPYELKLHGVENFECPYFQPKS